MAARLARNYAPLVPLLAGLVARPDTPSFPQVEQRILSQLRADQDRFAALALLLQARGLQLRPGITVDDIANLFAATIDGLDLRSLGDPCSGLIDHDRKRTLLGTAALAVIPGAFERTGQADGLSVEQSRTRQDLRPARTV